MQGGPHDGSFDGEATGRGCPGRQPFGAQLVPQCVRDRAARATGLTAALLRPHDLKELRDILARCRCAATVEDFVAHDIAFHPRIAEAVGNPVFSMLLQVLSTRTQRVRIIRGSRTRHAMDSAHQDHEDILRALQARDALLAVSAATVHVTAVEQWPATSCVDDPLRPIDG
jgi:DNA-binding FadR family transcriptional regulator